MSNKSLVVAKYEYLKTVRRLGFWLGTLMIPVLIGVISFISGYSSYQGTKLLTEFSNKIKEIDVIDETGVINKDDLKPPLFLKTDLNDSVAKVKRSEIDAVIYYPKTVVNDGNFQVYTQDQGLLSSTSFSSAGTTLLKQSVISKIQDKALQALSVQTFNPQVTLYDAKGNEVTNITERILVPAISAVIFFMSVYISGQFLLQSVAEEKENRMIETMLSIVNSKTLIIGKIIGLSTAVLTQLLLWLVLGVLLAQVGLGVTHANIAINIQQIPVLTVIINIYFTLMGFLLFAAIMVGVGAVGTSYKDSSSLSSIFIILSILPIYFITILVADPNGLIARIASYFPLTAPLIFMIRNSLTQLPWWELLLGAVLVFVYVVIAFVIATKLFNLGALMYTRRPTIKEIIHTLRK